MAVHTYDEGVDALQMMLSPEPEAAIERTLELGERLHVDVNAHGLPGRVEILYPSLGDVDLEAPRDRYGLVLRVPFRFAA